MAKALTPKLVLKMMTDEGKTQTEIARDFKVSRQYVHHLAVQGGYKPVTTIVTENFPWEVDRAFIDNPIYTLIRLHGRYLLEGGSSRSDRLTKSVNNFRKQLADFGYVVDYSPEYGPIMGVTKHGGFAYLPRTTEDENFIFKVREGVRITELGEKIWRLPED